VCGTFILLPHTTLNGRHPSILRQPRPTVTHGEKAQHAAHARGQHVLHGDCPTTGNKTHRREFPPVTTLQAPSADSRSLASSCSIRCPNVSHGLRSSTVAARLAKCANTSPPQIQFKMMHTQVQWVVTPHMRHPQPPNQLIGVITRTHKNTSSSTPQPPHPFVQGHHKIPHNIGSNAI
jgi:hypothetical protein